jgi:hypothetical protein
MAFTGIDSDSTADQRASAILERAEGFREGGRTLQEVAPSNGVGHVRLQFEQMFKR